MPKHTKMAAKAVIIKGNPKYIINNPKADAFYEDIRKHLAASGYDVSFDPGADYTTPPPADLWVGHSRGAGRLRFAPKGTRTLPLGSHAAGAVNHPDDVVEGRGVPPDAHYILTDEMKAALGKVAADYAPGLPSKSDMGPLEKLRVGQMLDYIVQAHDARRAGPHHDIRFGNPDMGLLSWAARKGVPEPGAKHLAVQQPVHRHAYKDFEGTIPSGYGAGTVKKHTEGQVLITKVTPESVHFTTAHGRHPERFTLARPKGWDKNWLLMNTTPRDQVPYEKVRYKKIAPEQVEPHLKAMQEGDTAEAKVDGASQLVQLAKGHAEMLSFRTSKTTGRPIFHTERFFGGRPDIPVPRHLEGSILKGEMYAAHNGRPAAGGSPATVDEPGGKGPPGLGGAAPAAPGGDPAASGRAGTPQDVGTLLNSGIARSLQLQKERGLHLRNMLYDVQQYGKTPIDPSVTSRAERRKMLEEIAGHLPKDKFHVSEEARDPESAVKLWNTIRGGEHPLTEEGVVFHPKVGIPSKGKLTEEHDVHITGTFPGEGKRKATIGGFTYGHSPGKTVGKVGTGFSDAFLDEVARDPTAYTGRVARLRAQQKLPSGALRAPSFLALHEDTNKIATAKQAGIFPSTPDDLIMPEVPVSPVRRRRPLSWWDTIQQPLWGQPDAIAPQLLQTLGENQEKAGALHVALADLKRAKAESDRGNYRAKHQILSQLLDRHPGSFFQDSAKGGIVGLTHPETGFKIHAPAQVVRGRATGADPAAMQRVRSLLGQMALEAEKRKYNLFAFAEDRANPNVGAEVSRVVDHPDSVVRQHQALHRQWAQQQGLTDHTWDPVEVTKMATHYRRIPLCMIKIALNPEEITINQIKRDAIQQKQDASERHWGQPAWDTLNFAGDRLGRMGYAMQGGLYGAVGAGLADAAKYPRMAGQAGQLAGIPGAEHLTAASNAFANKNWEGAKAGVKDIGSYLNDPVPAGNVNALNEANRAEMTQTGAPIQAALHHVPDWTSYIATQAIPGIVGGNVAGSAISKAAPWARPAMDAVSRFAGPKGKGLMELVEGSAPEVAQGLRSASQMARPVVGHLADLAGNYIGRNATTIAPWARQTVSTAQALAPPPTPDTFSSIGTFLANNAPSLSQVTGRPLSPMSRLQPMGGVASMPPTPGPAMAGPPPPPRPATPGAPAITAPTAGPPPPPRAAPGVPPLRAPMAGPPAKPVAPPGAPRPATMAARPKAPVATTTVAAPAKPAAIPTGTVASRSQPVKPIVPPIKTASLFARANVWAQQLHAAILRPAGMAVHTEPVTKTADLLPWVSLQPQQKRVAKRVREGQNLLVYHGLGSGKSLAGIAAAEGVGGPYTAVVPASLRPNYEGEINKFSTGKTPSEVMSYTGVGMGRQPEQAPETIIMDEVQRLRNPASAGSRAAMDLAMKAKHRVLLSGTPIVNAPSDLAVPLSILRGEEMTPAKFNKQFVGEKTVDPGWMGWFQGIQPAKVPALQNEEDLEKLLEGHVDYQPSRTPKGVTTKDERVEVDLSPEQQDFYKLMWGKLPWMMRWKLSNDFPLSKQEIAHLSSFMTGPRQAALSLYPYHSSKDPMRAYRTSSKLQSAMGSLKETLAKDPRAKALVYSNFIDAGLTPYGAALKAEGIPYGQFHGTMTEEDRKRALADYNEGRSRVLLLGPAAAEGISARGTQLIQLLDPHWNEARMGQARGRGLRFDSHEGLPPELRDVRIQRFVSKMPPPGWLGRLFGGEARPSADQILEQQAQRKEELNEQFREVLRRVGSPGYERPWHLFG